MVCFFVGLEILWEDSSIYHGYYGWVFTPYSQVLVFFSLFIWSYIELYVYYVHNNWISDSNSLITHLTFYVFFGIVPSPTPTHHLYTVYFNSDVIFQPPGPTGRACNRIVREGEQVDQNAIALVIETTNSTRRILTDTVGDEWL